MKLMASSDIILSCFILCSIETLHSIVLLIILSFEFIASCSCSKFDTRVYYCIFNYILIWILYINVKLAFY